MEAYLGYGVVFLAHDIILILLKFNLNMLLNYIQKAFFGLKNVFLIKPNKMCERRKHIEIKLIVLFMLKKIIFVHAFDQMIFKKHL